METTKTTFHLPVALHRRLKTLAARRGSTISRLLAEGAELVLARLENEADHEELLRRAREAEEALRGGLYEGPSVARSADDLAYGES